MSDANERLASFISSVAQWGILEALQLASLGFFVPASTRDAGRIKCSFCKRNFLYGLFIFSNSLTNYKIYYVLSRYPFFLVQDINSFLFIDVSGKRNATSETAYDSSEMEDRILSLKRRHSMLSVTCPMELYVVADNSPLSREKVVQQLTQAQRIDLINQSFLQCRIPAPQFPYRAALVSDITVSVHAEGGTMALTTAESTSNLDRYRLVPFDYRPGVDEEAFYQYRAEFEVDQLSEFNELDFYYEAYYNLIVIPLTPVDDLVGPPPVHAKIPFGEPPVDIQLHLAENRRHTFTERQWSQLRRTWSSSSSADYTTRASATRVCFWCGLELYHWESDDVPHYEHARFSPRCTWQLRRLGRPAIRRLLQADMRFYLRLLPESVQRTQQERIKILQKWEEMRGGIKCSFGNTDFRFEARELHS